MSEVIICPICKINCKMHCCDCGNEIKIARYKVKEGYLCNACYNQ